MAEFASHAVGNAGLTTGIIGTALGVLNGGLGNVLGGMGMNNGCCSENAYVNRYEISKENEISQLKMEKALLESNIYTDKKSLELYSYVDGRLRNIESQISSQAVWNATQTGTISCMAQQIAQLQGLTKLIVPASSICPSPMPEFNSWTAPTA